MDADALLSDLSKRGISVRLRTDGRLAIEPASRLTPEERDLVVAQPDALARAVRRANERSKEQAERSRRDQVLVLDLDVGRLVEEELRALAGWDEENPIFDFIPPKYTRFRTCDGRLVPLRSLSARDVQRLRRRGSLTDDETRIWLQARSARRLVL